MTEGVDEIPDDCCGFEVSLEDIEMDDRWGLEQWRREDEAIYCYRSSWRDERCIWHADVSDKPIKELKAARAEDLERLDGAILRDADIKNEISLAHCGLTNADLTAATLTDADLRVADLTNADLTRADLTKARLGHATLTKANLWDATLTDADLWGATLTDADLQGADFNWGTLAGATLKTADLSTASLLGTDLEQANLTRADLRGATLTGADLRGTDLKNADVRGAEFTDPDDPQARPANLEDSVVEGADLRGGGFQPCSPLSDGSYGCPNQFPNRVWRHHHLRAVPGHAGGGSGKKRHPNRRQRGCIAGSNHSTRRTQCPKKLDSTTSASRKPNEHTIYAERKRIGGILYVKRRSITAPGGPF